MKQHITVEQWDEINNDKKKKLEDFCSRNNYYQVIETGQTASLGPFTIPITKRKFSLLSIGQMIEFLEENNSIDLIRKSPIGNEWIINHPTTFGVEYIDKELCNCLWESVKEVLK